MDIRLSKILMSLALAAFAGLVSLDNIIDPGPNFTFVQHVLSMDTTLPGSVLKNRAITSPLLWQAGFGLIVAGEGLTALLFLAGSFSMWRARRMRADAFQRSKRWVQAAVTCGFLVWFFGFEVIGGEWFAMWQSQHWNGQDRAFTFTMTLLVVLLVINQPDRDPP